MKVPQSLMIGMIFPFCMKGGSSSLAQETPPSFHKTIEKSMVTISAYDQERNRCES